MGVMSCVWNHIGCVIRRTSSSSIASAPMSRHSRMRFLCRHNDRGIRLSRTRHRQSLPASAEWMRRMDAMDARRVAASTADSTHDLNGSWQFENAEVFDRLLTQRHVQFHKFKAPLFDDLAERSEIHCAQRHEVCAKKDFLPSNNCRRLQFKNGSQLPLGNEKLE